MRSVKCLLSIHINQNLTSFHNSSVIDFAFQMVHCKLTPIVLFVKK